ncbi:glycosyltransferase [Shewanella glacialipiscicola]|uniref:glycosyltransferase n=1 Tax=Shewanella glacialipiscicola TaxID=614069 RepID=UPI003D7A4288
MMNVSKITIITLTYKNWRLLNKAIASVVNQVVDQKYKIEYLIIDDGTDDFDFDYVSSLLKDTGLDYQIIVNQHNIGTVASFNNAIKKSSGDIIIPLSADDEFYDYNVLNDIAAEFDRVDAYIITGLRVPILNSIECQSLPSNRDYALFNNSKLLLREMLVGNIISGASTYYRRELFDNVGYFDETYRLLEDYPFYIKLLSTGINIVLLKRKVIKYGMSGISAAGSMNPVLRNDFLIFYNELLTRSKINYYERRLVLYFKVMSKKQRFINSWKYPDLFLRAVFNKVFHQ